MFIAAITLIAIVSVGALYAYASYNLNLGRHADPTRSGADPQFARMPETDWWDQVLASAEFVRK